jgi:hypothetical protein
MPAFVLVWCTGYYALGGEVIAVMNGYGWDGFFYGSAAWGFDKLLAHPVLDPYLAQRVAPSGFIHYTMKALGLTMNQTTVLQAFKTWNVILLTASAFVWSLTARRLLLKPHAAWIGFCGLFASFFAMKYSLYYPPLTDVTAFFLCVLAVWLYVIRQHWWILAVALMGYFTFPTMLYIAALLFLFPSIEKQIPAPNQIEQIQILTRLGGTFVLVLLMIGGFVYFVFITHTQFPGVEPILQATLYPSIFLVVAYSGLAAWFFLEGCSLQRAIQEMSNLTFLVRSVAIAAVWGLCTWLRTSFLQNPDPNILKTTPMTLSLFLGGSFSLAVAKPLLAVVSNAVYFGPIVVLCVMFYRSAARAAWQIGIGFALVFIIAALMSAIMSESRQFVNLLPVVVTALALALNGRSVTLASVAGLAALGLMCSKVWMTLNVPDMDKWAFRGNLSTSPLQRYFMNYGPWMSMEWYLWQGAAMLVVAGILWFLFKPTRTL